MTVAVAPRALRVAERFAAGLGVALLAFAGWSVLAADGAARAAVERHAPAGDAPRPVGEHVATSNGAIHGVAPGAGAGGDTRLAALDAADWAPGRLRAYAAALASAGRPEPSAVLAIARLGVRAAVFDGTDERVLNLGLGRVPGTGGFDGRGNLALAGHRDGFFRRLEHVAAGDEIELVVDGRRAAYRVERIVVVDPDDVYVLEPTARPALTLITCYPFRHVGPAPRRFVVRAALVGTPKDLHGKPVATGAAAGTVAPPVDAAADRTRGHPVERPQAASAPASGS